MFVWSKLFILDSGPASKMSSSRGLKRLVRLQSYALNCSQSGPKIVSKRCFSIV